MGMADNGGLVAALHPIDHLLSLFLLLADIPARPEARSQVDQESPLLTGEAAGRTADLLRSPLCRPNELLGEQAQLVAPEIDLMAMDRKKPLAGLAMA